MNNYIESQIVCPNCDEITLAIGTSRWTLAIVRCENCGYCELGEELEIEPPYATDRRYGCGERLRSQNFKGWHRECLKK
jgi:ssDNA-binding Zn-finger/Zn-ribbon topoisomerase 1